MKRQVSLLDRSEILCWIEAEDCGSSECVKNDWGASSFQYLELLPGSNLCLPVPEQARQCYLRLRKKTDSVASVAINSISCLTVETDDWTWKNTSVSSGTLTISTESAVDVDAIVLTKTPIDLPDRVREINALAGSFEKAHLFSGICASAPFLENVGVKPAQFSFCDWLQTLSDSHSASLEQMAKRQSCYLLKPYTTSEIDYSRDYVWHVLEKEKLWRFPFSSDIGIFNPNSGIAVVVHVLDMAGNRLSAGDITIHTSGLAVWTFGAGDEISEIAIWCQESDSIGINLSTPSPMTLLVECHRIAYDDPPPQVFQVPGQKFGCGVETTAGKVVHFTPTGEGNCNQFTFREWVRDRHRGRYLNCCLYSSAKSFIDTEIADSGFLTKIRACTTQHNTTHTARIALSLVRTTTLCSWNPDIAPNLYTKSSRKEAEELLTQKRQRVMEANLSEVAAEYCCVYSNFPSLVVPEEGWSEAFAACLDLPMASTYTPTGNLDKPFYNFCRTHAADAFNWWSYGMHAHENLSTLFLNFVNPSLSSDFLMGHISQQDETGRYPYGVSHALSSRTKTDETTLPLIPWQSWQSYLWSGDIDFLRSAFQSGVKSHDWWLQTRDQCGEGLCHWLNTSYESARDDNSLPTWTVTGGGEYQEALDLNCYLLMQEQALSAMARELGDEQSAGDYSMKAHKRFSMIYNWMWHEADQCYYGIGEVIPSYADVKDISTFLPLWSHTATPKRAASLIAHLSDPNSFATPYGPPTLAANEQTFKPDGHWHGANWVEMSYFAIQGAKDYGYHQLATDLAWKNCKMVFDVLQKEGHFREYFNSVTGEGCDLIDYIWTGMPAYLLVGIIMGIQPEADGLRIMPALPEHWEQMEVRNLSVRGRNLSIWAGTEKTLRDTTVLVEGKSWDCLDERGVFLHWDEIPQNAHIEIQQPLRLDDYPEPPVNAYRKVLDTGKHQYPDKTDLQETVKQRMSPKQAN